jgi:hypothetical protein
MKFDQPEFPAWPLSSNGKVDREALPCLKYVQSATDLKAQNLKWSVASLTLEAGDGAGADWALRQFL